MGVRTADSGANFWAYSLGTAVASVTDFVAAVASPVSTSCNNAALAEEALKREIIWTDAGQNTSYSAEFVTTQTPPIEMKYNGTDGNTTYEIDMKLTYNQPDTYNCSVFTMTFTPNETADVRAAAMYVRGGLPNGTLPPDYCQIEFMTHCFGIIYKPYNWNCSVSEPTGQQEEQK
ncbi:uncharacterized protein [Dermacentor andersoni]|uniref:uncharacterized protein n=1 Tax=Dermacentor andersoni TaxID=34620 RepID=UPI002417F4B6|nr:uncharacterized protein LOC129381997 isoform X2 [Dermacentor andersoni]